MLARTLFIRIRLAIRSLVAPWALLIASLSLTGLVTTLALVSALAGLIATFLSLTGLVAPLTRLIAPLARLVSTLTGLIAAFLTLTRLVATLARLVTTLSLTRTIAPAIVVTRTIVLTL